MQIAANGAPAALVQSLEEDMLAAGVPESARVVAKFEAPIAIKGVASLGVQDYWIFVKSQGAPAVVKRAESDDERAAAARAMEMAQYEEAPLGKPQTLESARFEDETDASVVDATPDMEGGDHPDWRLQRAKPEPDAMETLKSMNRRLSDVVPMVERLHPLQKSFLLSVGYDGEAVASGNVDWTMDLRRRYDKWLAKQMRDQSRRMLS